MFTLAAAAARLSQACKLGPLWSGPGACLFAKFQTKQQQQQTNFLPLTWHEKIVKKQLHSFHGRHWSARPEIDLWPLLGSSAPEIDLFWPVCREFSSLGQDQGDPGRARREPGDTYMRAPTGTSGGPEDRIAVTANVLVWGARVQPPC